MKVRENLSTILIYAVTLLILIFLILFVNPENLVNSMIQLGFWGILILGVLYIIDLIIRAFRWKFLLIAQGIHLSVKSLILPVASALAINLFTIARAGEFARLYALKRNNNTKYSDTLSSIVIEQILSIFGLLIVITGGLFFLSSSLQQIENSELIQQLITLLFIGSVSILIILSLIMIFPEFVEKIIRFFPLFIEIRLLSAYRAFLAGLSDLRSKPSLLFLGILSSTFIWLIEGLMLHVIAIFIIPEFGIIDLPWTITASCAGNITFIIPILPGAMG
ncbi:MAG: YbhN family protein, partial [Candidatus Hodarchaeota archaeon]